MSGNKNRSFRLCVISSPGQAEGEWNSVHRLFELGMENFHLRKPGYSSSQMRQWLKQIDPAYHHRIILHGHYELARDLTLRGIHVKLHHRWTSTMQAWLQVQYLRFSQPNLVLTTGLHSLESLRQYDPKFQYVFLSPVFDSISKVGYKSAFSETAIRKTLSQSAYEVIALGGVNEGMIHVAREWGFAGVAVLGAIWKSPDPAVSFIRIREQCETAVTSF